MTALSNGCQTIDRAKYRCLLGLIALVTLSLVLSGCKPFKRNDQPYITGNLVVINGESLGQSFVSQHAGLVGIQVYLSNVKPGDGQIILHLRKSALDEDDLAVSSLDLTNVKKPRYYGFTFTPQPGSRRQDYFFWLEIQGTGKVQVSTGNPETYLDGASYRNFTPLESQLTFGAIYDPLWMFWGLLQLGFYWSGVLLAGILLFILPGWALLSGFWKKWGDQTWLEKFALSAGVSLAVYPILMLWTSLVGLRLGAFYAWLPPLAGGVYLIYKNRHKINYAALRSLISQKPAKESLKGASILGLATIVILLGIVFSRFWSLHNLDAPMWGDSLQHSMITQLIINNHGLFSSWRPYAELSTFTYHFGFHSAAAVFDWVTGAGAVQSVLWSGQFLNLLAVLAVYPLAMRVYKNRWVGAVALLIAGLLSPMPMTYINWGRYTQLAGQVILPAIVCLLWDLLEREDWNWRLVALTSLAFGGLALTHYRILILVILFIPAWFILLPDRGKLKASLWRLLITGIGGGILFLPWFIHIFKGQILTIFAGQLSTPVSEGAVVEAVNNFGSLFTYLPAWVWILLPVGLGWGLWKRNQTTAVLGLWWLLILLATNPEWLRLPGAGAITNFTVLIAFYIPTSALLAPVPVWLVETIQSRLGLDRFNIQESQPVSPLAARRRSYLARWMPWLALLLIVCLVTYGTRLRLSDVKPAQFSLTTRADSRAFDWIRVNTPEEAVFLVNSFLAYGGSTSVGCDGGWWLPLFTQRKTNLPPINYGTEQSYIANFRERVKNTTLDVQKYRPYNPQFQDILEDWGITHIYIGQQQGGVNNTGAVLQPELFMNDPHYKLIYHQDRVFIFEAIP